MSRQTIDTERLKATVDLRRLAEQYTALRRESHSEMSGPCPQCGGHDRFHVKATGFFCRQCKTLEANQGYWYDAIEFVRWMGLAVDFRSACEYLAMGALPVTPAVATPSPQPKTAVLSWRSPQWQETAHRHYHIAHEALLHSPAAAAAREYLLQRGLEPQTWEVYQLGFVAEVSLPGTEGRQRRPAISIPWFTQKWVRAIRYRFLQTHEYINRSGQQRQTKQTALYHSQFAGALFGGQALSGAAEVNHTLVLVEGEINAMSIYQVAYGTRVNVLSLGGESAALTPAMINYAQRYASMVVWMDREAIVKQMMRAIPEAYGFPSLDDADANDLLQQGKLAGALAIIRTAMAQTHEDKLQLLGDLGANRREDPVLMTVIQNLAEETGTQLPHAS